MHLRDHSISHVGRGMVGVLAFAVVAGLRSKEKQRSEISLMSLRSGLSLQLCLMDQSWIISLHTEIQIFIFVLMSKIKLSPPTPPPRLLRKITPEK